MPSRFRGRSVLYASTAVVGAGGIYVYSSSFDSSTRIKLEDVSESKETSMIPSRKSMITDLKTSEYDVLIIGGGSTGTGAALDAVSRGLKVVLVEREDFSSGTSSRSTKLIWGGSRYLVQALVQLLNPDLRLIFSPISTISKFSMDFNMVLNCHKERKFLLEQQPHLTSWLPIAVPITKWFMWPPPFGFYPASLGPLGLFPVFFKFYDSLSSFSSPPSHIMSKARSLRKFPQLNLNNIKYCSIFYEGIHDDARTNLCIAETAAIDGATVLNYMNVVRFLREKDSEKIIGAVVQDAITGEIYNVRSKSVLMCGGPFTDDLRMLEDPSSEVRRAVKGAHGIHIVLPSYYAPKGIGLLDMNTSDGRFLFYLPWEGHVLIGTTDKPCEPSMRPVASETEIQWILKEASKYLSPDVNLRREDVLSAWNGIRPLAIDPNRGSSGATSTASRDHLISFNPKTGVVFISGGKWTTYREMAEDAIDKVLEVSGLKPKNASKALQRHLVGYEGYSSNMHIPLIHEFGIDSNVAERLVKIYGGRARDVLRIAKDELKNLSPYARLVPGYPYLMAEVLYAVRHEWAVHINDIIARRTRLAFLDKVAAQIAIPAVVKVMSDELKWDEATKRKETRYCLEYLRHFGGPVPDGTDLLKFLTKEHISSVFCKLDHTGAGKLDSTQVMVIAEILGLGIEDKDVENYFAFSSVGKSHITLKDFSRAALLSAKKKLS